MCNNNDSVELNLTICFSIMCVVSKLCDEAQIEKLPAYLSVLVYCVILFMILYIISCL